MAEDSEQSPKKNMLEDTRLDAELGFTNADFEAVSEYLASNPIEILKIPHARTILTLARLARLDDDQVMTYEKPKSNVLDFTLDHNLERLKDGSALLRPALLIDPLCRIDFILRHVSEMKVLTVGPRTECEIFTLVAGGFLPENIFALDLISYSKFIDLGDMHDMPYDNNSFDIVLLPWVLGYSGDIPKAVEETLRVAKPGAYIGVGGESDPNDKDTSTGKHIDQVWDRVDTLIDLFGDEVGQVIFKQDKHPLYKKLNLKQNVTVIFNLKGELRFPVE